MQSKNIEAIFEREIDSHKYDYGHVLIVGGAPSMVGAPLLSAMAALRTGAGLVSIGSFPDVVDKLEKRVLEVMTYRIDEVHPVQSIKDFVTQRKVNVIIIGPGFDQRLEPYVEELISTLDIPAIVDAGAMLSFKNNTESLISLTSRGQQIIFTPHDGEFKKLTGIAMPKNIEQRKAIAKEYVDKTGIKLVSKGTNTIVTTTDSQFVNDTGNPGMATAGSGDVLCGITAGLIAQGIDATESTQLAVKLHGLAGDIAANEKTQAGMIASDIVESIPYALKSIS